MGDAEYGKCDICGNDSNLSREYYYYNIRCDCCNSKNDNHFEYVSYCAKCKPKPPEKITVHMQPDTQFRSNKDCEKHYPDWHGICFKCGKQIFKTSG